MESSVLGRLGLKTNTTFKWKGKTFSQVSSILQKNKADGETTNALTLHALPNKLFRREIAIGLTQSKEVVYPRSAKATIATTMDYPGATIVSTQSVLCEGIMGTVDLNFSESKTDQQCSSGCNSNLNMENPEFRNSKYIQSLSMQDNARRRVRSAGMSRPRYSKSNNSEADHYASAGQYMHSRNKTFQQNQFSSLRVGDSTATPGTPASLANEYSSNTIQYCNNSSSSSTTNFVPVFYKPNNSKYAQQGAVDAGCRITRLKYDTITNHGNSMFKVFGRSTANSLAYGGPPNGYTIKDKIGYPNKCTPVFCKSQID
jgi:hypothetical protein